MAIAIKTTLTTSRIVEVDGGADLTCAAVRDQVIAALERGQIVVLPQLGFELTPRERDLILDTKVILPTQKEQDSGSVDRRSSRSRQGQNRENQDSAGRTARVGGDAGTV